MKSWLPHCPGWIQTFVALWLAYISYLTLPQILDVYQAKEEAAAKRQEVAAANEKLSSFKKEKEEILLTLETKIKQAETYKKHLADLTVTARKVIDQADVELQRRIKLLEIVKGQSAGSFDPVNGMTTADLDKLIAQVNTAKLEMQVTKQHLYGLALDLGIPLPTQ
ncbi:hypothetical protein N825_30595 [Skermanella stibiiresistens SB22]|uniref:Uncharacterized protein n=1 Tax=Skermanella stibiiresistens SB22 TaxID=1385369 RepID=W9H983_9PROT|nr:hypothetical protein N825_30595 [Skermanella stibiiresistens SB22]